MKTFIASLFVLLLAAVVSAQPVWMEAEDGALTAPLVTESAAGASGTEFVVVHGGAALVECCVPVAVYTFTVPVDGTYTIWGRTLAPTSENDSFWASVDGSEAVAWWMPEGTTWVWDQVNDRGSAAPVEYALTAGDHTLVLSQREPETQLDALVITNDNTFVPVGVIPNETGVEDPTDLITLTFSFTEPVLNTDGSALVDLASCTVIWTMDNQSQPDITIPASAPTGGGDQSNTVATSFDRSVDHNVGTQAYCNDSEGNQSVVSVPEVKLHIPLVITVDTIAPAGVSAFGVTATFE